jgi:ATP-dependent metalloprotease FtsH
MKRPVQGLIKNFIIVVLIFVFISAIFALFAPSPVPDEKNVSLNRLARDIEGENIEKIKVSGEQLAVFYKDGTHAEARKEEGAALTETLSNYGVEKEKLNQLELVVETEKTGWGDVLSASFIFLPILFLIWFFWIFLRQSKAGAMQAFNFSKTKARIFGAEGHPKEKINFNDVAGLSEAKEELKEIVEFLRTPKKFLNMGAKIPRGVLLLGPPGCGKCIVGDTFVPTSKGLIKIKDVPKYFKVDEKGKFDGGKIFTIGLKNLEAKKISPSHWFNLGTQKTIKIVSQVGIELEGTPEHPVVILNKENGNFEFKRLDQIKEKDFLVVNYNYQSFGDYKSLPDKDTAYLLGLLSGDGGLSIKDKIYFSSQNKKTVRFVNNYFKTRFGIVLKKTSRKYDWYISNWQIKEKLREYGLTDSYARGKRIPESILLGPKEFQTAFLRGLFDTDGYAGDKQSILQFSSSSKNLAREVNMLLLNLGIINRFHAKRKMYNNQLQYYIEISGDFVKNFAEEISFQIEEKQAKLKKILQKQRNTNVNLVPFQKERLFSLWKYFRSKAGRLDRAFYHTPLCKNTYRYIHGERSPSKRGLDNILEFFSKKVPAIKNLPEYKYLLELGDNRFFFTPVVKIIKNQKAEVYDFTVPKEHSFVANGLVNHNTLLARATAGESNVPFFSIAGSEFIEMFVGVGSGRVRSLFQEAKKHNKSIIFIDELDAIGRTRGVGIGGGHDEREQTLNQILVEMDGFERDAKTIILAATNRPDILDSALLRPGRFDRQIVLNLPSIEDREAILKIHSRNKPLSQNAKLREIAERTPGFSGADLENLLNEAAILAARRNKKEITQEELTESIEKVLLGPERKSYILSKKEKEISAYHEAGHALVATFTGDKEPVRKISIVARGMAGGYILKTPSEERKMKTKDDFIADIATLLGGYCAEKMIFGKASTGSSNDLQQASLVARRLIKEYGMSEKLGPVVFGEKNELKFLGKEFGEEKNYSEKIAQEIDKEVFIVFNKAQKEAEKVLKSKKRLLEKLAQTLIIKETIEREELEKILKVGKNKGRK